MSCHGRCAPLERPLKCLKRACPRIGSAALDILDRDLGYPRRFCRVGSNYLAGRAPKRRRLPKAEASDAGNVVVLACARTPR